MVNLYPLRATNPDELPEEADKVFSVYLCLLKNKMKDYKLKKD